MDGKTDGLTPDRQSPNRETSRQIYRPDGMIDGTIKSIMLKTYAVI